MLVVRLSFAAIVPVIAFSSCRAETDAVVAHSSASAISKSELYSELASEPAHVRRRFNSSINEKKRYIEQLARAKTLFEEARRQNIDRDPALLRRFQQLVVDTLIQRLREKITPASISDAEVERFYQEHRADYEHPATVRASQILVGSRAEAEELRAEISGQSDPAARLDRFRAAAARKSLDAVTKYRGGDLGFVHAGTVGVDHGALGAVLALRQVGELSPVIAVGERWALLMKTGEQPERRRTLDELRPMLQMRLVTERRDKVVEELLKKVQGGALKIDEAALRTVSAVEGVASEGGNREE